MEELKVAPEYLRQKVDQDAKVMAGINNCIKNANRNERNVYNLRSKMSGEFRNLSNLETNPAVVGVYSELANGYDVISKSHLAYIEQVENKVLPVLVDYQRKIKEVKNSLAAYQSKRQNLTKQELAYNRTTDPSKTDAARKALEKAQGETVLETTNFTKRLKAYQFDRMLDTKEILLHTINAEMYYHSKALEKLSDLYVKAYNIDDQKEAQEVLKTLINTPPLNQSQAVGQNMSASQNPNLNQNVSQNIPRQNMGTSQIPNASQNLAQQSQNIPRQNMGQSSNLQQYASQNLGTSQNVARP